MKIYSNLKRRLFVDTLRELVCPALALALGVSSGLV